MFEGKKAHYLLCIKKCHALHFLLYKGPGLQKYTLSIYKVNCQFWLFYCNAVLKVNFCTNYKSKFFFFFGKNTLCNFFLNTILIHPAKFNYDFTKRLKCRSTVCNIDCVYYRICRLYVHNSCNYLLFKTVKYVISQELVYSFYKQIFNVG